MSDASSLENPTSSCMNSLYLQHPVVQFLSSIGLQGYAGRVVGELRCSSVEEVIAYVRRNADGEAQLLGFDSPRHHRIELQKGLQRWEKAKKLSEAKARKEAAALQRKEKTASRMAKKNCGGGRGKNTSRSSDPLDEAMLASIWAEATKSTEPLDGVAPKSTDEWLGLFGLPETVSSCMATKALAETTGINAAKMEGDSKINTSLYSSEDPIEFTSKCTSQHPKSACLPSLAKEIIIVDVEEEFETEKSKKKEFTAFVSLQNSASSNSINVDVNDKPLRAAAVAQEINHVQSESSAKQVENHIGSPPAAPQALPSSPSGQSVGNPSSSLGSNSSMEWKAMVPENTVVSCAASYSLTPWTIPLCLGEEVDYRGVRYSGAEVQNFSANSPSQLLSTRSPNNACRGSLEKENGLLNIEAQAKATLHAAERAQSLIDEKSGIAEADIDLEPSSAPCVSGKVDALLSGSSVPVPSNENTAAMIIAAEAKYQSWELKEEDTTGSDSSLSRQGSSPPSLHEASEEWFSQFGLERESLRRSCSKVFMESPTIGAKRDRSDGHLSRSSSTGTLRHSGDGSPQAVSQPLNSSVTQEQVEGESSQAHQLKMLKLTDEYQGGPEFPSSQIYTTEKYRPSSPSNTPYTSGGCVTGVQELDRLKNCATDDTKRTHQRFWQLFLDKTDTLSSPITLAKSPSGTSWLDRTAIVSEEEWEESARIRSIRETFRESVVPFFLHRIRRYSKLPYHRVTASDVNCLVAGQQGEVVNEGGATGSNDALAEMEQRKSPSPSSAQFLAPDAKEIEEKELIRCIVSALAAQSIDEILSEHCSSSTTRYDEELEGLGGESASQKLLCRSDATPSKPFQLPLYDQMLLLAPVGVAEVTAVVQRDFPFVSFSRIQSLLQSCGLVTTARTSRLPQVDNAATSHRRVSLTPPRSPSSASTAVYSPENKENSLNRSPSRCFFASQTLRPGVIGGGH